MHVWRDRMNRWLTPLARRTPLSPNAISTLSLVVSLAAGVTLAYGNRRPLLFFVSPALFAIGGLLDLFDGIVARVQERTSRFGDFLDHFFDRVADTAIIACWCIGTEVRMPLALASVSLVLLSGYIGTQIEATFGKRSYEGTGRGEFVLALIVFPVTAYSLARSGLLTRPFGGFSIPEWMTLLLASFALLSIVQRFRMAERMSRDVRE